MRIRRRFLPLPILAMALQGAAAPAAAQAFGATSAEFPSLAPRVAARFTSIEGTALARGDTLRLRSVLLNLGDTTLTVDARECQLRVTGELELAPVGGERECAPRLARVAPGDSLVMERAFVAASAPGKYRVRLEDAAFLRRDGSPLMGSAGRSLEVAVVEPGDRAAFASGPGTPARWTRVPLVVRFRGEPGVRTTEDDVVLIVTEAAGVPGDLEVLPLHPDAPRAAGGMAHFRVDVSVWANGDHDVSTAVVGRDGSTCGESGVTRRGTNLETGRAGQGEAVFGALLALSVRRHMEQAREGATCFPGLARATAAR